MLEKTERAIKDRQSIHVGNMCTIHRKSNFKKDRKSIDHSGNLCTRHR